VLAQTVRPLKWIIVNDGSTDGTPTIIDRYAASAGWIERLDMPTHRDRNFAAKADADITFEPEPTREWIASPLHSLLHEKLGRLVSPGTRPRPPRRFVKKLDRRPGRAALQDFSNLAEFRPRSKPLSVRLPVSEMHTAPRAATI
jgi:glycosyltransferase involved in cell wall biosynthesis